MKELIWIIAIGADVFVACLFIFAVAFKLITGKHWAENDGETTTGCDKISLDHGAASSGARSVLSGGTESMPEYVKLGPREER